MSMQVLLVKTLSVLVNSEWCASVAVVYSLTKTCLYPLLSEIVEIYLFLKKNMQVFIQHEANTGV